ncbi:MAG: GTPase, partial [Candidatus Sedimenticola sp. (ex Thyasira tokunagai)]
MVKHPVFAVVGHPNKGKSSVVAALTQNDQVEISPLSGTTRVAQHFT